MSLNAALLLVATLGFLGAVIGQIRSIEQDSATFQRKRRRAAWAFAGLLLFLGTVRYGASGGFD